MEPETNIVTGFVNVEQLNVNDVMLKMIKWCKVPNSALLEEQYQITEYGFCANVDEHKIRDVICDFICLQKCPIFFILELPTNERDERRLRKNNTDPFHTDVYYLDGLNSNEAIALLNQYGELLVQDGMSSFGFGTHDSSAELCVQNTMLLRFLQKRRKYIKISLISTIFRTLSNV